MPNTSGNEGRSKARREAALKRCEVVQQLAAKSRLTILEVEAAASSLGLSRTHFYRLLEQFRKRPRLSTLLPKAEGRKVGTRLVSLQIELIVENSIESFYLQRIKPPFSALVRQIQADCHQAGLKPPDRKTIRLRLSSLDERKVMAARLGAKAAKERYGHVSHAPAMKQALERVQIDHTPVDLIVVDEINRKPLGRPWLSLAIDNASRMVCGFFLSMIPPSSISVALALAHFVAPKDLWLADRELSFEWPVSGLPDLVYMDNAKEFGVNIRCNHAGHRLAQESTAKLCIVFEVSFDSAWADQACMGSAVRSFPSPSSWISTASSGSLAASSSISAL
jgi:putative transposase